MDKKDFSWLGATGKRAKHYKLGSVEKKVVDVDRSFVTNHREKPDMPKLNVPDFLEYKHVRKLFDLDGWGDSSDLSFGYMPFKGNLDEFFRGKFKTNGEFTYNGWVDYKVYHCGLDVDVIRHFFEDIGVDYSIVNQFNDNVVRLYENDIPKSEKSFYYNDCYIDCLNKIVVMGVITDKIEFEYGRNYLFWTFSKRIADIRNVRDVGYKVKDFYIGVSSLPLLDRETSITINGHGNYSIEFFCVDIHYDKIDLFVEEVMEIEKVCCIHEAYIFNDKEKVTITLAVLKTKSYEFKELMQKLNYKYFKSESVLKGSRIELS